MPFQFYCPQGHLLQGLESQMGQQSQCPLCGSMFVVPMMPGMQMPQQQQAPAPTPPIQPFAPAPAPEPEPEPPKEPEPPPQPTIVHIECPKGHMLETPSDILGQIALCPYCNSQFELLYESSIEYRQEKEEAARKREEEMNALWVKWSIRAAIGVGVMFGLMIFWVVALRPFIKYMMEPPAVVAPAETPAAAPATPTPAPMPTTPEPTPAPSK